MGFFTTERKLALLDIENFRNYFLTQFKAPASGREVGYEMWPERDEPLGVDGIKGVLKNYRIITFNGNNYDIPILTLALAGANNRELKAASDEIIQKRMRPWTFYDEYRLKPPDYLDHIDLYEVAPGVRIGLKKYGARMHTKWLQDLPFHHDALIAPEQRPFVRRYCINDLDMLWELACALEGEMNLRNAISDKYGMDVRSKSDAQIAEAIIKNQVEVKTGRKLWKEERERKERVRAGLEEPMARVFNYKAPDFIQFEDDDLCDLLREIETAAFRINSDSGKVMMPAFLEKRVIQIGDIRLTMGIGGIHSTESKQIVKADDEFMLCDRDVTSYYPFLILICAMFPPKLGAIFLEIYRMIVEERVAAKHKSAAAKAALDKLEEKFWKTVADSMKIFANGAFGKLGSEWSVLYAPHLLIQVTITGQLAILMLIARAYKHGFKAVSANTDGVVFYIERERKGLFNAVVTDWEWDTGLNTEEVEYKALYSRDVNNYLAITTKDEVKGKGIFTKPGLKKDPQHWICYQAVIDFLKDGRALADTISSAGDIRDFVQVRAVGDGGGVYNGKYLGKTVRWYMSTDSLGPITMQDSGNKVAGTDGCMPCMTLPDEIPDDLDRQWYLNEAHAVLDDLGYDERPLNITGRRGKVLGYLPGRKNVHVVDLGTMAAACGAMPASRREPWIEVQEAPAGQKLCVKCQRADSL